MTTDKKVKSVEQIAKDIAAYSHPLTRDAIEEICLTAFLQRDKEIREEEREIFIKIVEGKLETWAALEHSRWSKWQAYLHSKLYEIDDTRVSYNNHLKILPTELFERWERQINTAYSDLSDAEKESDREQVRPYIEDIRRSLTPTNNTN